MKLFCLSLCVFYHDPLSYSVSYGVVSIIDTNNVINMCATMMADVLSVRLSMRNGTTLVNSILLEETGLSTGVFTSQVRHPGSAAAVQGQLAAIVTYSDTKEDGSVEDVFAHAAFASPGQISCSSSTSYPGTFGDFDTLTITVVDADLDQTSLLADSVGKGEAAAVIIYGHDGDVENVEMSETSESSGVFTGVVQTSLNASDHAARILSHPAGVITATFADSSPKALSECFMRHHSIGKVSTSAENVLPLHPFTVTVTDADLNIDAYSVQATSVSVAQKRADKL